MVKLQQKISRQIHAEFISQWQKSRVAGGERKKKKVVTKIDITRTQRKATIRSLVVSYDPYFFCFEKSLTF